MGIDNTANGKWPVSLGQNEGQLKKLVCNMPTIDKNASSVPGLTGQRGLPA